MIFRGQGCKVMEKDENKKKSSNNINNSQWDKDGEQKIHQNRNKEQFQTVSSTLKAAIDEDGFLREREREWRRQVLSRFKLSRWADSVKSTNFNFSNCRAFMCEMNCTAHICSCRYLRAFKKYVTNETCACVYGLSRFISTNTCIQHMHTCKHTIGPFSRCVVSNPPHSCAALEALSSEGLTQTASKQFPYTVTHTHTPRVQLLPPKRLNQGSSSVSWSPSVFD